MVILAGAWVAATGQEPPPNLARDRLLGPVKAFEHGRIPYVSSGGQRVEGKRAPFQKLTFDNQGNRIEAISYDPNGVISTRLVYTYDALGRNTGYEEHYKPESKSYTGPRKHIFTLDENGRIVEFLLFEADGSPGSRFTYKYDAKGNKLEETYYGWTGALIGRMVYTYDATGHAVTTTSYNRDEKASAWNNTDSFDAQGRRVEWVQYQAGVLRNKKLFKFDSEGRITEEQTFEFNAPPNIRVSHAPIPGKIVYTYNDSERSTETATYTPDGNLKGREIRKRDEKGNEISLEYFEGDGSVKNTEIRLLDSTGTKLTGSMRGQSMMKFEYDEHGNWTRKTYLILAEGAKEPQPYGVEYRDFVYYGND